MTDITIYHNPDCGTSRNTLAMIRNAGVEPRVVLYLEAPPSQAAAARADRGDGRARARRAAAQGDTV